MLFLPSLQMASRQNQDDETKVLTPRCRLYNHLMHHKVPVQRRARSTICVRVHRTCPTTGNWKKPRKNAKRPVTKKCFYVHEDSELNNLLNAALRALDRHEGDNALSFSWLPRTGAYWSRSIDIPNMTFAVNKTQFKDFSPRLHQTR